MNLVATIESDGTGTRYVVTARGESVELWEADSRYGQLADIIDSLFPAGVPR